MALRKATFRIYPTAAQTERLEELLGLHQRVYNTALEERIRAYRERGESLNYHDQAKALTQWRAAVPALAGVNAQSQQNTLKRLDRAFQAFFRRVKCDSYQLMVGTKKHPVCGRYYASVAGRRFS